MKKVLYVSNVLSHIYAFHMPYINWFKQNGFEVHVMANSNGQEAKGFDKYFDVKIERSPFSLKNIAAYKEAKIIIDSEKYDIVHCHTPMGGVIGRLASRKIRKQGSNALKNGYSNICFVDDRSTGEVMGLPVAGTSADIPKLDDGNTDFIIGIGNNAIRKKDRGGI